MDKLNSAIERLEKQQIKLNAQVKHEKRVGIAFGLTIGVGFVLCMTSVGICAFENNKIGDILEQASQDPAFIEYRDQDLKNHYLQYEQDGDIAAYNAFSKTVASKSYISEYLASQPDSTAYSAIESAQSKLLASAIIGIVGGAVSLGAIGTYEIGFNKAIPAKWKSDMNKTILKKLKYMARQDEDLPALPEGKKDEVEEDE